MLAHHGANYSVPVYLKQNLTSQDILLLPSRDYLRRFFPADQVLWAEPRMIYYMAGSVRTVSPQSPDWASATHAVIIAGSRESPSVRLTRLSDAKRAEEIRSMYVNALNIP
jgi:hypothetical protein